MTTVTAQKAREKMTALGRALFSTRLLEVLLGLGALGAALALLLASSGRGVSAPKQHGALRVVAVGQVSRQVVTRPYRFSTVTRAKKRAQLGFTVGGRLASRPVRVGDRVRVGQVLAKLESGAFYNGLGAAAAARRDVKARLAQAERDLRRVRTLVSQGVLARARLERAQAQTKSLRAMSSAAGVRVAESWRTVKETVLRAPFSGVVTDVRLQPGEVTAPGRPIIFLSGAGPLEARVEVPEAIILRVQAGQRVALDFPLLGRRGVLGRIAFVGRTTAGVGRLFPVIVELPASSGLRAGMTAEVIITERLPPALTVPVAAVVNPSGRRPAVYVVRQGRVRRVAVQIGLLVRDRVTVVGELHPTELVAVSGHADLLNGDPVKVQP